MIKLFKIGDFCFKLSYPQEIIPPSNFLLFETKDGAAEYSYEIKISNIFPDPEGIVVARRPDLVVFKASDRESRLIGVKGIPGYYAFYREISENSAEVIVSSDRLQGLHIDPVFTSLLALERRMVQKNSVVLHCAYLEHKKEAILFSAPSETGKTTQANLWEKHRGSRTINGDRALLRKIDNRWIAEGWPVCGTSEVCYNQSTPIRAIVLLTRGKENQVARLTPMQAFSLIYGQITINQWSIEDNKCILDLIEDLVKNVPVFYLSCTISEAAVDCLEKEIYPLI